MSLSAHDLEIVNVLFPQAWQVALIMRPGNSAASRVRFYFRELEGPWTTVCAVREFTLPAAELRPPPELPAAPAEEASMALARLDPPSHLETLARPPRIGTLGTRSPLVWPLAAIAAAAVLGGIYWFMRPQPLDLRVQATDSASQVRIAWERTAGAVHNGRAGYLDIEDGGQSSRLDLDAEQLHIGYVNYPRRSNEVTVRLVVQTDRGAVAEDVARFVAPPGEVAPATAETARTPAPDSAAAPPDTGAAPAPESTPELIVPVPVDSYQPLEERPKFRAPQRAKSAFVDQPAAPEVTPPAQLSHPAPASLVMPQLVRTEPPVEKPALPSRPASAIPAGENPAPASAAAAIQNPSHAAALRASALSSGRVLWIGRLQKNQPLTISGRSCSTGTLIGELPARPFKFSISPGDLSGDGIVLFTSNLQFANNVVEPPGAENGWNKTVYTWNPKYANDVSVDETPAAKTGWSRMVLHSRNPKISVLVIDWTAVN